MAWVKPASDLTGESLIIRRTVQSSNLQFEGGELVNYELGLSAVATGLYAPHVRHIGLVATNNGLSPDTPVSVLTSVNDTNSLNETRGGHQATGLIAAGEWAHIAGSYNADTHTMSLYVNGELSVYRNDVFPPSGMDLGTDKKVVGALTIGGGEKAAGMVEKPFKGWMDEVKVLDGASGVKQIQYEAAQHISTTLDTINLAVDPDVRQIPISEALQYEHTNSFVMVRFKSGAPASALADATAALGLSVNRSFQIAPIHRARTAVRDRSVLDAGRRCAPMRTCSTPNPTTSCAPRARRTIRCSSVNGDCRTPWFRARTSTRRRPGRRRRVTTASSSR